MEAEVTSKVHKTIAKKTSRLAIIGFVVILLLGAAFAFYFYKIGLTSKVAVKQQTAVVKKGDLAVTISGSGAIASANRKEITPVLVSDSKITKSYFSQGDKVKAGDLMFELDNSDAVDKVESVNSQLTQAQLSQSSNVSDLGKLIITAPFSGYATNVLVKDGDNLNKGQTILTLVDKKKFKVTLAFNAYTNIKAGDSAKVFLVNSFQYLTGSVSFVSDKSYSGSGGLIVRNVDIIVSDPSYTIEGLTTNAQINGIDSDNSGTFAYANTQIIKTDVAGTIKKVNVNSDQFVNRGTTLVELQSDDLLTSKQKSDLSIQDLQTQLDNAKQKLNNYKIVSPIDGTIVKQTIKVGDVVKSAQVLSTVSDNGHMEFTIPVDELDIAKVQIGQKTKVTVDALADTTSKPLSGTVTDIALEGTSSNGVTTYPVTITIDNPDRLKGGMNANASIIVNSKTNVLYIPIQAVQKMGGKSFVWVKGDATTQTGTKNGSNSSGSASSLRPGSNGQNGGNGNGQNNRQNNAQNNNSSTGNQNTNATRGNSANQQYYAGAVRIPVEVGMSTDADIEILSGLKEGDVVVLPAVAASTSQQQGTVNQQRGGGTPFGGGFGGGRG